VAQAIVTLSRALSRQEIDSSPTSNSFHVNLKSGQLGRLTFMILRYLIAKKPRAVALTAKPKSNKSLFFLLRRMRAAMNCYCCSSGKHKSSQVTNQQWCALDCSKSNSTVKKGFFFRCYGVAKAPPVFASRLVGLYLYFSLIYSFHQ
jgi:hypothetical protein